MRIRECIKRLALTSLRCLSFAEAVSYSLAGTASQRSDIRTYSSNPAHLGDNENCTPYEYVHVLGGDGSPRLGRLRAPDAIELSNYYVKQTAYG